MGKHNQSIGLALTCCRYIFFAMLLCMTTNAMALTPENGWWWQPLEPGRGFNIEVQNDTVFLASFVYKDDGSAVWYSGSGNLNADNTATFDLLEFANGQCIRCSFQTADLLGRADTITLRFLTSSTAELDWSGGTVSIQRFNFNLGENWQNRLLGEWIIVSGSTVLSAYSGDRVIFDSLEQKDTLIVNGHRVGNNNARISVFDADANNGSIRGFSFSGLMSTNSTTLRAYAFDFSGLNRLEGVTVDLPVESTAEQIKQTLVDQGVPFIAFRIK